MELGCSSQHRVDLTHANASMLCPNAGLLSQEAFGMFAQTHKYIVWLSGSSKNFIRFI